MLSLSFVSLLMLSLSSPPFSRYPCHSSPFSRYPCHHHPSRAIPVITALLVLFLSFVSLFVLSLSSLPFSCYPCHSSRKRAQRYKKYFVFANISLKILPFPPTFYKMLVRVCIFLFISLTFIPPLSLPRLACALLPPSVRFCPLSPNPARVGSAALIAFTPCRRAVAEPLSSRHRADTELSPS